MFTTTLHMLTGPTFASVCVCVCKRCYIRTNPRTEERHSEVRGFTRSELCFRFTNTNVTEQENRKESRNLSVIQKDACHLQPAPGQSGMSLRIQTELGIQSHGLVSIEQNAYWELKESFTIDPNGIIQSMSGRQNAGCTNTKYLKKCSNFVKSFYAYCCFVFVSVKNKHFKKQNQSLQDQMLNFLAKKILKSINYCLINCIVQSPYIKVEKKVSLRKSFF